jgi:hypothetical protein
MIEHPCPLFTSVHYAPIGAASKSDFKKVVAPLFTELSRRVSLGDKVAALAEYLHSEEGRSLNGSGLRIRLYSLYVYTQP